MVENGRTDICEYGCTVLTSTSRTIVMAGQWKEQIVGRNKKRLPIPQ